MKPINELTIAMASDHAGFGLKSMIQLYLEREGAKVIDFGCHSMENCDFPDFAHPMATAVEKGECDLGIGFCYTGNGMAMAASTSFAMLLPISTPPNAIACSTGLIKTNEMAKVGLIVGLVGIALAYAVIMLFPF